MLTKKQIYAKKRYAENREYIIAQATAYHYKNRERINKRKAEKRRERGEARGEYRPRGYIYTNHKANKREIIERYGGVCVCCGEDNIGFLTIDHIENDGHSYRNGTGKTRLKGSQLYSYLKKENYPSNVQVLCFNCNIGRHNNSGICPHKGEKANG